LLPSTSKSPTSHKP